VLTVWESHPTERPSYNASLKDASMLFGEQILTNQGRKLIFFLDGSA